MAVEAAVMAAPIPMARLTRRQTCSKHRPFATEREAWLAYIAQLIANTTDPGQDVYKCAGHWHHGGSQVRSLGRLLAESGWDDHAPAH